MEDLQERLKASAAAQSQTGLEATELRRQLVTAKAQVGVCNPQAHRNAGQVRA